LAIAWSVDPKAAERPMQIQIDQDAPVPVPHVRLMSDARLEPAPGIVMQQAWEQVKTEKYAEAVAQAAEAARDKRADAVAI
jgi:hypothetical protein